MKLSELNAGDQLPELRLRVTRETAVRYAGASGDFNPIHYSDFEATQLGLDGVIVHGMWTMGAALRAVTEAFDEPVEVRSYQVRFTRPVQIPDDGQGVEVVVLASVQSVADDAVSFALQAECDGQKVLGAGKVSVQRG